MSALTEVQVGQRGRIISVGLPPEARQRLIEMGLTKGVEFEVVRYAPLGDPIDLKLRGYHLSIRKHEAQAIEVEVQ